jgi:hypothetical protein
VREYIQENFVKHGMIADFAIHDNGDGNPHVHILLTMRDVDKNGFGKKNRTWNSKARLENWRGNWAVKCNAKFQEKGLDVRIDHRSLKNQGLDREPQIYVGYVGKALERKGIITERVQKNYEIISRNLDKEITKLEKIVNEARREMGILGVKAETIAERAEHIQSTSARIDELRRGNWTANIRRVEHMERSHRQAIEYFKEQYGIAPENAGAEVERIERTAQSKRNLHDKLRSKLDMLIDEKERIQGALRKASLEKSVVRDLMELREREREKGREHEHIRLR